jgi:hypothetical protein
MRGASLKMKTSSRLSYVCPFTSQVGFGTFDWTAPEVLVYERATYKADVFSYAVILWYGGILDQGCCTSSYTSPCGLRVLVLGRIAGSLQ